ncbi:MAG: hypothetical protein IKB04_06650 [Clostridia bacterium]|nr:hypothetical protein [Clostridia bacterium]
MRWRANITYILRHQDNLQRLIKSCDKVKDAKYTYGEFDDEDIAEAIAGINNLIKRIDKEGGV